MRNAKNEILELIVDKEIKCAIVTKLEVFGINNKIVLLKNGYSKLDYEKFLNELNFNYDCGYGGQELFGTVWFEDGSWAERGEYDGAEWWEIKSLPIIPDELI